MRPGLIPAAPGANAANRYVLSLLLSLEKDLPGRRRQTRLAELAGLSLADYLDSPARSGQAVGWHGDVLIFDQFEEILTVDPTDRAGKPPSSSRSARRCATATAGRSSPSARSSSPAWTPTCAPSPPASTRATATGWTCSGPTPRARPCRNLPAPPVLISPTRPPTKLADDLRAVQVQLPDGSTSTVPGNAIEPVQLQVVCRRLWDRLPPDDTLIDITDVQEVGDVDTALRGYYADSVAAVAAKTGIRERAIREWTETQLITEQGIRGQVLQGPAESPAGKEGLENRGIWPLVDAHLVRAEQRRGATWFELAHDRLIEPVRKDNAAWREAHLSPLQRQAALWDGEGRPERPAAAGPRAASRRAMGG